MDDVSSLHLLPHFFTTLLDAREAVTAHYADDDVEPIEIRQLARSLHGFCWGYLMALAEGETEHSERRKRENTLRNERMRRRRREAVAA